MALQHWSGFIGFQQPKTLDKMMNDQKHLFPAELVKFMVATRVRRK